VGTPAGFISRTIAMVVDLSILVAMIAIVSSLTQLATLLLPRRLWFVAFIPAVAGAVVALLPFLYFFVLTALFGRTAGKQLMGLRVVRNDGANLSVFRSLVRVFAYYISLVPLGAGFAWVIVDGQRRAWHDHIAGSRVVHSSEGPRPIA
jgi:uncharacterized RDD family membrane protein YckC